MPKRLEKLPGRFGSSLPNLPQKFPIHLLPFLVEPPAVLSEIFERASDMGKEHFSALVRGFLVVVNNLNAWKIERA